MQTTNSTSTFAAAELHSEANLRSIAISLQQIAASLQRSPVQPTGFTATKTTIIVYANLTKGNGDGWYTLENHETKTMLPEFYGVVTGFEFPKTTRRNQEVTKFHLHMKDLNDNRYIFESGLETFFTRSALWALAHASPEELQDQLRLYSFIPELTTGDKPAALLRLPHS